MSSTPIIPVRSGEFEGPLDLLLELVRRNQVSLESMPLADITRDYLTYMREAQRANVDLGAEFIYMAATLIQMRRWRKWDSHSGTPRSKRLRTMSATIA